jgi:Right handed beta helix region
MSLSAFSDPSSAPGHESMERQIMSDQGTPRLAGDLLTHPDSRDLFGQSDNAGAPSFPARGQMGFGFDMYGDQNSANSGNETNLAATEASILQGETSAFNQMVQAALPGAGAQSFDNSSVPGQSSENSGAASGSAGAKTALEQQILTGLNQIDQDLQQIVTELGQLIAADGSTSTGDGISTGTGAAGGDSTSTGGSSQPGTDNTAGGTGVTSSQPGTDSSGGSLSTTSGAGASNDQTGSNPASSTGDATGNTAGSGTAPASTAAGGDGVGAATISTANGTEQVGSTATVFGLAAMPSADPVADAFYVSADASGDGTGALGSQDNPFSTLQQAQQAMEDSSTKTTYVDGGTYDLSSTLNLTSSDSGETFTAAPGSSQPAVIDGGGSVSNLISIDGANDVSVTGLTLQDTQPGSIFSSGDWTQNATAGDAIVAKNSNGDNFSYDTISNVGLGLDMRGVSNSQFNDNAISNVQDAIALSSANNYSNNNSISGNDITNVSDVASSPYGAIDLGLASNNTINNNIVENVTGAGIRVTGNIGQNTSGNVITQNTVEDVNTAAYATSSYSGQGDNGAIYAWQAPGNTNNMDLTISNNYVADFGQGYTDTGIYLDDGVDGANVTDNVVSGNGIGLDALIHGGSDNTFTNNVFNMSSSSGLQKGLVYQNDGPQMTNNNVDDNIFYATTANGGAITSYNSASGEVTAANNIYQGTTAWSSDTNPITADPQFVDPADGNYTVQAGSPAAAIGF